jgi:hypothetical protein
MMKMVLIWFCHARNKQYNLNTLESYFDTMILVMLYPPNSKDIKYVKRRGIDLYLCTHLS